MARLSFKDVEEVARLASKQRLNSYGSGPTTYGLADALGLPPTEIERLLEQVRRSDSASSATNGSGLRNVLLAAVVAVVALLAFGLGRMGGASQASAPTVAQATPLSTAPQSSVVAPQGVVASARPSGTNTVGDVGAAGANGPARIDVDAPIAKVKTSASDLRNAERRANELLGDPHMANDPSPKPLITRATVQSIAE